LLVRAHRSNRKILWQKENSYQDVVLSPTQKQQLEAEEKLADAILAKIRLAEMESAALRKKLSASPDNKEELQKKLDEFKTQTDGLKLKLKDYPLAGKFRQPHKDGTGGFSSPTPTTDGKNVYVIFGNGLATCYDLEGNRKWIQNVEHSTAAYGHGSSPLKVGNKLLVHFADLVALDVKDGSESWRAKLPPNHGTPIHTRIGNVDVAIHPNGLLVRVADGVVLADKLGSSGPNSPLLHDGIVYFIRNEARAVRLPVDLAVAKPEPIWKARLTGGGYWFASPVYHEGLVYGLNAMGILSVIEAGTGKLVYEKRLPFGGGQVYPIIAVAGGLVFNQLRRGHHACPGARPRIQGSGQEHAREIPQHACIPGEANVHPRPRVSVLHRRVVSCRRSLWPAPCHRCPNRLRTAGSAGQVRRRPAPGNARSKMAASQPWGRPARFSRVDLSQ